MKSSGRWVYPIRNRNGGRCHRSPSFPSVRSLNRSHGYIDLLFLQRLAASTNERSKPGRGLRIRNLNGPFDSVGLYRGACGWLITRIVGENVRGRGVFGAVEQPQRAEVTARLAVRARAGRAGSRRGCRSAVGQAAWKRSGRRAGERGPRPEVLECAHPGSPVHGTSPGSAYSTRS